MDVAQPPPPDPLPEMAARLRAGLARAPAAGLVEVTEMGMRPLVGLARLVNGRAERPGFRTADSSENTAGQTWLSADPRDAPAADIDLIDVYGTAPVPFAARS
ncbi:MAG TPA: hypothetical protein VIV12_31410 [Streptosporangiaceae bacterium]